MRHEQRTQVIKQSAALDTAAEQRPMSVILTCTGCGHTYEPSAEDFAAGRTECPDPDCLGWTFWAQLRGPGEDQASTRGLDGGCAR